MYVEKSVVKLSIYKDRPKNCNDARQTTLTLMTGCIFKLYRHNNHTLFEILTLNETFETPVISIYLYVLAYYIS